jgi:diguanylate cyclase (GGDEF)-like protein
MSIQSDRPAAYRDDQVHLLERIAVHAAIAIENARLYAEVQRLAIIDELTRIYNYRGLVELGSREVEHARRFNHPLCALFFDIDGFRQFNNQYSHVTGNIVLRTIAQSMQKTLRAVDVFARYGGDEFVILLPETNLEGARFTAERIQKSVAATKIPTQYGELSVTISLGVALLTDDLRDLAELIDRASRAEHVAKDGRQGVAIF